MGLSAPDDKLCYLAGVVQLLFHSRDLQSLFLADHSDPFLDSLSRFAREFWSTPQPHLDLRPLKPVLFRTFPWYDSPLEQDAGELLLTVLNHLKDASTLFAGTQLSTKHCLACRHSTVTPQPFTQLYPLLPSAHTFSLFPTLLLPPYKRFPMTLYSLCYFKDLPSKKLLSGFSDHNQIAFLGLISPDKTIQILSPDSPFSELLPSIYGSPTPNFFVAVKGIKDPPLVIIGVESGRFSLLSLQLEGEYRGIDQGLEAFIRDHIQKHPLYEGIGEFEIKSISEGQLTFTGGSQEAEREMVYVRVRLPKDPPTPQRLNPVDYSMEMDVWGEVLPPKELDLSSMIRSILKPEVFSGENSLFCEACDRKTTHEISNEVVELPDNLILSTHWEEDSEFVSPDMDEIFDKRTDTFFSQHLVSSPPPVPQALTTPGAEPPSLSRSLLPETFTFPGTATEFRAWGVVRHLGTRLTGHFIAYIREGSQWLKFDMDKVESCPIDEALSPNCHVIIYRTSKKTNHPN